MLLGERKGSDESLPCVAHRGRGDSSSWTGVPWFKFKCEFTIRLIVDVKLCRRSSLQLQCAGYGTTRLFVVASTFNAGGKCDARSFTKLTVITARQRPSVTVRFTRHVITRSIRICQRLPINFSLV